MNLARSRSADAGETRVGLTLPKNARKENRRGVYDRKCHRPIQGKISNKKADELGEVGRLSIARLDNHGVILAWKPMHVLTMHILSLAI